MKHLQISRIVRLLGPMAVMFALLMTLALPATLAQQPVENENVLTNSNSTASALCCDDPYLEVGVEYVQRYDGGRCSWPPWKACFWRDTNDIPNTRDDAKSVYDGIRRDGRFLRGNGYANEDHWIYRSGSYPYINRVDLAYFSGHGNSSGFFFGDYSKVEPSECKGQWGGDTEWIALAACQTMKDWDSRHAWRQCMNGLHLLLGFETNMDDVNHGQWFARYANSPYFSIGQAWFIAADRSQSQGRIAWVIAEEKYQFNDRYYHHRRYDPYNGIYFAWRHHAGSEPARYVDSAQLNGTMPVFNTPAFSLDEANAKWQNLGQAFDTETSTSRSFRVTEDGTDIRVSEDGQLEMDTSSGLFGFTDSARMWTVNTDTIKATQTEEFRTLSEDEARQIADFFLTENGLMPADAEYYEVIPEVIQEEQSDSNHTQSHLLNSETMMYQVVYSRILTYTPPSMKGALTEPIEFSVMGPGAKLKVYVAPQVSANVRSIAQAADEAIMGTVGGYRQIEESNSRSVADTVEILSYQEIETLFRELEPVVALNYMPMGSIESKQILSHTLAYYEHSMGTGQDQLIPVYALNAQYMLEGGDITTDTLYIPANPEFMAPTAMLTYTVGTPISSTLRVGQEIVLQAVDASQTLAELGIDDSLNFALGTSESDSYLYNWYLNEVDEQNLIGTGRTLNYTVTLDDNQQTEVTEDESVQNESGSLIHQVIILEVTDSLSPRPPSRSETLFEIDIVPPLYLPLVIK